MKDSQAWHVYQHVVWTQHSCFSLHSDTWLWWALTVCRSSRSEGNIMLMFRQMSISNRRHSSWTRAVLMFLLQRATRPQEAEHLLATSAMITRVKAVSADPSSMKLFPLWVSSNLKSDTLSPCKPTLLHCSGLKTWPQILLPWEGRGLWPLPIDLSQLATCTQ